MGQFEGFADADGKFFKALAKNQKRDWFEAHKHTFEEGWNAPMKVLLAEVRGAIDRAYAHCDLDEPKVFRIYRDVRFSKDKTPYKTWMAGCIPTKKTAKVTETPVALYVHFGTETAMASGLYRMEPDSLARYRTAVAEDARGKELAKILTRLTKDGYSVDMMHDDHLKKVPKGYDADHPRAELLKRKGLGVAFPPLPKGMLASPKLVDWLATHAKKAAPLVEWLVFATA
jgi:uncharacterized protein (TIGR02453 family)